jgi:hypothetical protein
MKLTLILIVFALSFFCEGQTENKQNIKNEKEITLVGHVTDINGLALTRVDILVKGTSFGVKSNFDGEFSLKGKKGDVIVISHNDFKTKQYTLGNKMELYITLEEKNKSEPTKALTKSEIRKKKRSNNKASRTSQRKLNSQNNQTIDTKQWLMESAGRTAKGIIRKNSNKI